MRTVTVTEKYRAVQEGRMAKSVFLQQMKREYPFFVSQFDNFDSSVAILKNKGMLFEQKKDDVYNKDYYKFSDEGVRRGTDAELTKMGIDSTRPGNISKEDLEKAKETALKNLRKDPLYYLNLLSGDSLHVDKHDKPVEYKKGNEKDVFNGMKKAELKEEVSEADPIPTEPGIPGQRASNHNRKMALRKIIDTLTKDGHPEKGYKVSNDEALSFIRTYRDEIFNGTIDFNNAEAIWDEYEESESIDRDSVDEQEVEEQMTDQQMKDIQNYGKADKIVKPFKPGDAWSDDFDYEGMLEAGLKVRLNTPLATMEALHGSFEDVNYHSENKHLRAAIDAIAKEDKSEALDHLRNFRKAVKETLLSINEGGNPSRELDEEKRQSIVKKNVKAIIEGILTEEVINEAATNQLAKIGDDYEDFGGMKQAIIDLQNIVTDIESYYGKTKEKIQKIYDSIGEVTNEEGLKVGAFIAPAIESAFKKDLRPIISKQFHGGISLPQVKRISQADIDRGNVAEKEIYEEPKETVFTPPTVNGALMQEVNKGKHLKKKRK